MINKIKRYYEKNITIISIISILIGFIGTGFCFYSYCYPKDSSPKLTIVEISQTYLFINNKEIKDLKVFYKDKDLNKEETNLIVMTVRLTNLGKTPVRLDDYANDGVFLKFSHCKLIASHIEKSINLPISNELNPEIIDSTTLKLNKVVFNPEEEVIINIYLLHNTKSELLDYSILGRIAGQGNVIKTSQSKLAKDTNILQDLWNIFMAFLPFFLIILCFIILVSGIEYLRKNSRKRWILNKFNFTLTELNFAQISFVEAYKILGKKKFIFLLKNLLKGNDYIDAEENLLKALLTVRQIELKKNEYNFSEYYLVHENFKKNRLIIKNENNSYIINPEIIPEIHKTLEIFKNKY